MSSEFNGDGEEVAGGMRERPDGDGAKRVMSKLKPLADRMMVMVSPTPSVRILSLAAAISCSRLRPC